MELSSLSIDEGLVIPERVAIERHDEGEGVRSGDAGVDRSSFESAKALQEHVVEMVFQEIEGKEPRMEQSTTVRRGKGENKVFLSCYNLTTTPEKTEQRREDVLEAFANYVFSQMYPILGVSMSYSVVVDQLEKIGLKMRSEASKNELLYSWLTGREVSLALGSRFDMEPGCFTVRPTDNGRGGVVVHFQPLD